MAEPETEIEEWWKTSIIDMEPGKISFWKYPIEELIGNVSFPQMIWLMLRADFHVCGHPKPLEDTVFMTTKYEGDIPGTLMATRQAPGNRGGLRLRIFGSKGGLEWDMENAETLKLNVFGQPDQVLTRGHGHGVSARTERFVRTGRGFPEGLIEAWANLYTEFALAVSARQDGIETPNDWLGYPKISEGVEGVKFIEASVRSNQEKAWAVIE